MLLVVCHCPGSRALTCFPNTITRKHFQYSQPSHQHRSNHQLHGNPRKRMNGHKWPNDLVCRLGKLAVLSHTTSRLRSGRAKDIGLLSMGKTPVDTMLGQNDQTSAGQDCHVTNTQHRRKKVRSGMRWVPSACIRLINSSSISLL